MVACVCWGGGLRLRLRWSGALRGRWRRIGRRMRVGVGPGCGGGLSVGDVAAQALACRARAAQIARTGRPELMARAELMMCAARGGEPGVRAVRGFREAGGDAERRSGRMPTTSRRGLWRATTSSGCRRAASGAAGRGGRRAASGRRAVHRRPAVAADRRRRAVPGRQGEPGHDRARRRHGVGARLAPAVAGVASGAGELRAKRPATPPRPSGCAGASSSRSTPADARFSLSRSRERAG